MQTTNLTNYHGMSLLEAESDQLEYKEAMENRINNEK